MYTLHVYLYYISIFDMDICMVACARSIVSVPSLHTLRETLHAIGSDNFAFDSTVDCQSDSSADRRRRYRP